MIRDPYVLKFLGLNPNDDFNELELETIKNKDMHILAKGFSKTAKHYGLELCTCSELIELDEYEICHAHCIDYKLLECLGNCLLIAGEDKNQRKECGCVTSVDIGAYNTCKNLCKYCYANFNTSIVNKNYLLHSPASPLLFGETGEDDRITERKMKSFRDGQMRLF